MKAFLKHLRTRLPFHREVLFFLVVTSFIFVLRYFIWPPKSIYAPDVTFFEGTVIAIENHDNYFRIVLDTPERLIGTYFESFLDPSIQVGSLVRVHGVLEPIPASTFPYLSSWQTYYRSKSIFYYLTIQSIEEMDTFFSIKGLLLHQMNCSKHAMPYLKAIFLGDSSAISEPLMTSFKTNGLTHLFAFSGMHFQLLDRKLKSFPKLKGLVLFISFLLLHENVAYLRAFISRLLNHLFGKRYRKTEIILLSIGVLLLINPFFVDQVGFWYSVILSSSFILFYPKKVTKSKLFSFFRSSLFVFLVSLPIQLWFFYKVNWMSILLNTFFIPYFDTFLLPCFILTFFFPILDSVVSIFISIFEQLSLYMSSFNSLIFIYGKPSVLTLILWILLVIGILCFIFYRSWKNLFTSFVLLPLLFVLPLFREEIVFLDVGQGDATYFSSLGSHILLDTGNTHTKEVLSFLEATGTTSLDYLILSHGDDDHLGNALAIMDKVTVQHLIYNPSSLNESEKSILMKAQSLKIPTQTCQEGLHFQSGSLSFYSLTQKGDSENENSCIFYVSGKGLSFLFTGDMTSKEEVSLMKKYQLSKVDYLKVAHHGSKTSTSDSFIAYLKPRWAIISVGKNNRYHHPHPNTLANLSKYGVAYYLTSEVGSVQVDLKNNTLQFYPPYNILGR